MQTESSGYKLWREGALLCTSVWGTFDPDLYARYEEELVPLQQQLAGQRWGVLLHLSGPIVVEYDLAVILMGEIAEGRRLGRRATAIVIDADVLQPDLVEGILAKVYRRAAEPHAFFSTPAQARDWLQQHLAG